MTKSKPYHFSIGAVSQRTGISTPNIRMWEARHAAIEPERSETGRRMYRETEVQRLILLKQLVDVGHPIRTIASLETEQLEQILTDHSQSPAGSAGKKDGQRSRLLIVGPGVGAKLRGHPMLDADFVDELESIEAALSASVLPAADLLVVEVDNLFPNVIASVRELVRRTGAKRSLLTYFFSNSKTAQALVQTVSGLTTMRAPVESGQLLRECLLLLDATKLEGSGRGLNLQEEIPERAFTAEQLAHLTTISSTVECECPQHLAEVIQALSAFEDYSRQCEDRNSDDALLHAYLHRTAAQARHNMENALKEVLHAEGIEVGG